MTHVLVDGVVKEFVFEDVHYFEKMSGTLISHCILAHLGYKFNGDACSKDSLRDLVHRVTRDNEVAFNVVQPKTSSRMFVQVQEIPKLASATQVNKSRGVAEVPVSPHDTVKSVGMKVCNSECANQDSWIPKLKPLKQEVQRSNEVKVKQESPQILNREIFSDVKSTDLLTWHMRFGHTCERSLRELLASMCVTGVKNDGFTCAACLKGKMKATPKREVSSHRAT